MMTNTVTYTIHKHIIHTNTHITLPLLCYSVLNTTARHLIKTSFVLNRIS